MWKEIRKKALSGYVSIKINQEIQFQIVFFYYSQIPVQFIFLTDNV